VSTEVATDLEQRLAELINASRSAEGLSPLKIEAHLNASAQAHSDWMAETETFSHEGEDGSSSTDRIEDTGFPLSGNWRTSENLAYSSIAGDLDAGEADRMHAGLMDSAGHRANIMDPEASYVGIGLSVGNISIDGQSQEVVFLTQNFADTDGEVLVQEEADGETVFQPYQGGAPVGEPRDVETPAPEDPDDKDREDERESDSGSGGGCFVATAAYGDHSHPDVKDLRRFRDKVLVRHGAGRAFIRAYCVVGPKVARLVSHDGLSGRVGRTLISPLARLAGGWSRRRR
jgi:hypothetical protein